MGLRGWKIIPMPTHTHGDPHGDLHTHGRPGARFTKYRTTILRLSYDNAKVTIDLRLTSKVQNILRRTQGFSYVQFTCKIVRSSKIVFVN